MPPQEDAFLTDFRFQTLHVHQTSVQSEQGDDDAFIDRGDFVNNDSQSDIRQATEDPHRYTWGSLYPIYIGEILVNRYRIEHKLGSTRTSTVWMAYDTLNKKDVTLKIMASGKPGENESHIQHGMIQKLEDASHLLLWQETFLLHGSHGDHRVNVFRLFGPSLRDFAQKKPIAARMLAAKQLLQGLNNLHVGGIVHRSQSASVSFFHLL